MPARQEQEISPVSKMESEGDIRAVPLNIGEPGEVSDKVTGTSSRSTSVSVGRRDKDAPTVRWIG